MVIFPSNQRMAFAYFKIISRYFSRADTDASRQQLRQSTLHLFEQAQLGHRLQHVKFQIFGDEIANRWANFTSSR